MKLFKSLDLGLLFPAIILFSFGVTTLFSTASQIAQTQLIFGVAALLVFIAVSRIDYRILGRFSWAFYFLGLFFLILTFFIGQVTRGSVRWIDLSVFRLQPSEISKPLFLIYLISIFSNKQLTISKFLLYSIIFFVPVFLILKQPDLGSAIVFMAMWFGMLFISGYKPFFTPLIGFGTIIFLPLIWKLLKDYQKERILSFINPGSDPLGSGYNAIQAIVAVGSGGLFGRGLGRGTQSHLLFLPEYHTDFIFASFAEELGFIGVFILLSAYFFLLIRILKIAKNTNETSGSLICLGVFIIILTQSVINIGMNIGILPITGITLPFVSYGGSSLISMAVLLGMVNNISCNKSDHESPVIR